MICASDERRYGSTTSGDMETVAITTSGRTTDHVTTVKLGHEDFWPACLHAEEGFTNVHFERFEYVLEVF